MNRDTNHIVTLHNLALDTRYYYRVTSVAETAIRTTPIESFRTLKPGGSVSFAVISDTAYYGGLDYVPPQALLAGVLNQLQVDLVLHLGDIVTRDFNSTNVQFQFFDLFQPVIRTTPFFLTIGNHDLYPALGELVNTSAPGFHQAFSLPRNSMDGTSRYYSFDHGDAHFVCLFNPWFCYYDFNTQTDQYRWLTNDLASSTKPWKLLFFHAPIATSSVHAYDDYNGNDIFDQTEMFNCIVPLARRYGVQMVFNGHDHSLHRYPPCQGLHFCVTAGGGQSLYPFVLPTAGLAKYWEIHHCLKVGVTNDTMTFEAFNTAGERFDTWTLQKALPPQRVYYAAWHTPSITSTSANDGDGNIGGQIFDFSGTPLYPRAGEFSNLGRIYVNHDGSNLYVGFEQVMIQSWNNVFLFIESPRCSGVSTMAGLGNGRIDPEGQGADGLDCLENLSFTNFAPCVGCLLGDEFADQTMRCFTRADLGLDIGQGIFHLDKELVNVHGARLQQFNLSPQVSAHSISSNSIALEQNADCIQLSIPLRELGGLLPGDRIKVGAVVGGQIFDEPAQLRWIDTSVLGCLLEGSGMQPVLLEGLVVELAPPPTQDSDHDGFFDCEEQLAGTDPHNPHSSLVMNVIPISLRKILLSWQAVPGRRYQLEFTRHLCSHFEPFMDPTFPRAARSTTETQIIDLRTNPSSSARFYRIRLLAE